MTSKAFDVRKLECYFGALVRSIEDMISKKTPFLSFTSLKAWNALITGLLTPSFRFHCRNVEEQAVRRSTDLLNTTSHQKFQDHLVGITSTRPLSEQIISCYQSVPAILFTLIWYLPATRDIFRTASLSRWQHLLATSGISMRLCLQLKAAR